VLTSVLLKQQTQSTRLPERFYRSKPDLKLNMSSIVFDVNSLSNRLLNRLAVAHPLLTYVIVLSSSSRAYFLFPQHYLEHPRKSGLFHIIRFRHHI
jgi:hypothetical protein